MLFKLFSTLTTFSTPMDWVFFLLCFHTYDYAFFFMLQKEKPIFFLAMIWSWKTNTRGVEIALKKDVGIKGKIWSNKCQINIVTFMFNWFCNSIDPFFFSCLCYAEHNWYLIYVFNILITALWRTKNSIKKHNNPWNKQMFLFFFVLKSGNEVRKFSVRVHFPLKLKKMIFSILLIITFLTLLIKHWMQNVLINDDFVVSN